MPNSGCDALLLQGGLLEGGREKMIIGVQKNRLKKTVCNRAGSLCTSVKINVHNLGRQRIMQTG